MGVLESLRRMATRIRQGEPILSADSAEGNANPAAHRCVECPHCGKRSIASGAGSTVLACAKCGRHCLATASGELRRITLASRSDRLIAFLIDKVVLSSPLLFLFCIVDPWLRSGGASQELERGSNPGFIVMMLLDGFALLALFCTYMSMLSRSGETFGKRWLGIRIICLADARPGGFWRCVIVRFLFNLGLGILTYTAYAWLDAVCILREDRRCIHDILAGTCVIVPDDEKSTRSLFDYLERPIPGDTAPNDSMQRIRAGGLVC